MLAEAGPPEHREDVRDVRGQHPPLHGHRVPRGQGRPRAAARQAQHLRGARLQHLLPAGARRQLPPPQQVHAQVPSPAPRDIKLENVVYNEQFNSLKLIDFGSALRFEEGQPRERRCTGTVGDGLRRSTTLPLRSSTASTTASATSGRWASSSSSSSPATRPSSARSTTPSSTRYSTSPSTSPTPSGTPAPPRPSSSSPACWKRTSKSGPRSGRS